MENRTDMYEFAREYAEGAAWRHWIGGWEGACRKELDMELQMRENGQAVHQGIFQGCT